jgi:hypothetical protein
VDGGTTGKPADPFDLEDILESLVEILAHAERNLAG